MTISDGELLLAFDDLYLASSKRTLKPARLGVLITAPDTYSVDVPGKPYHVSISLGSNGTEGLTKARDAVGVDRSRPWQRIGVRKEGNEYVIREAQFYTATGGSGGATTLDGLTDVDTTGVADGDLLAYSVADSGWIPYTPAPGGSIPLHGITDPTYHSGVDAFADQFLLADGSRTLTGDLDVAPTVMIDGVDISAHVISNPDAHHNRVTSGNVGIGVVDQVVSLVLSTDPGLEFSSGVRVKLPSNSGLLRDATGIHISVGNGIEIAGGNFLRVDEDANFTWTGLHVFQDNVTFNDPVAFTDNASITTGLFTFNTDPQIQGNIDFLGATRSITNADGGIDITPLTDLYLNPGSDIRVPNDQTIRSTDKDDLPTGIPGLYFWQPGTNLWQLNINSIKADQLFVRVFTVDEVRLSRGEEYWSKGYGIVNTPFAIPVGGAGVSVWFDEAPDLGAIPLFEPNDRLFFRIIDMSVGLVAVAVWFRVVGQATPEGWLQRDADNFRQQWRIARLIGGTDGFIIRKGVTALNAGNLGTGWIHLNALTAQDGSGGPYIQMGTMTDLGSPPVFTNRFRVGNLSGVAGYSTETYGVAAGNDLSTDPDSGGFSGFTITSTEGLKLYNTAIRLYDGSTLVTSLDQSFGLSLVEDTDLGDNEYASVSWYKNLTSLDLRAFITSYQYDSGQGTLLRAEAINNDDNGTAQMVVAANSESAESLGVYTASNDGTSSYIYSGTNFLVNAMVGIGTGLTSPASRLHLRETTSAITAASGYTIEQAGSGDSVMRWFLSAVTRYYSAGIDNSDGDKWKLSSGSTLGSNDFFIFDPSTGAVSIPGFDYTSSPPPVAITGGDGIDIVGSTISVDSSVVRTGLLIIAGSGLAGGGDLSGNVTLTVNVGAGLVISSDAVNFSGTFAGTGLTLASGILSVNTASGITTSGDNIILNPSVAGTGLSHASGILSLSTSLGGLGLTYTSGVLDIDPALAGEGLAYSSGIMSIDSSIAGNGLDYNTGVLSLDPNVAGDGLLHTTGVLSVRVSTTGGIQITSDLLNLKLPTISGLITDTTGLYILRKGGTALASGLDMTAVDGLFLADSVAGAGLVYSANRVLAVGSSSSITVNPDNVEVTLATNSGLIKTSGLALDPNVAGAGLTLALGVLTVNTASGITKSGDNVVIDPNIAGTGLSHLAGVLNVNTSGGLTTSSDNIIVNLAFDFAWTGDHTWGTGVNWQVNSLANFNQNVNFVGARSITSSGNLLVTPTGDLTLDPSGNIYTPNAQTVRSVTFTDSVTGILGYSLFDTGGNVTQMTIGKIKADEMFVRFFTADEIRVNRGSEFWSRSYGIVQESFNLPADEANVDVWFEEAPEIGSGKLFLPGNWIQIRSFNWTNGAAFTSIDVWFVVVDAGANDYVTRENATTTVPSRQKWTLKRKSGGSDGFKIRAGNVAVDFGIPVDFAGTPAVGQFKGQGVVYLSALDQDDGPFVQIQSFETVTSDVPQFANRVRMGNLRNVAGISGSFWGVAAGDNLGSSLSSFSGFVAGKAASVGGDSVYDGLNIYNAKIKIYESSVLSISLESAWGLVFEQGNGGVSAARAITWVENPASPGTSILSDPYSRISSYASGAHNSLGFTSSTPSGTATIGFLANADAAGNSLLNLLHNQFFVKVGVSGAQGHIDLSGSRFLLRVSGTTPTSASSSYHFYETNTTTGAASGLTLEQGSTGDANIHLIVAAQTYSLGIDNSVAGDPFKISAGAALGTGDLLTLTSAGDLTLAGTATFGGAIAGITSITMTGAIGVATGLTVATTDSLGSNHVNQILLRSERTNINTANSLVGGISFQTNDTQLTAPGAVAAMLEVQATNTHNTTDNSTRFAFYTTNLLTMAEAFRIEPDGSVQAAAGIRPTAASDTIASFDEGTWTPAITFTVTNPTSITYTSRYGKYTRINNLVHFQGEIVTSAVTNTPSAASGVLLISLPFTSHATGNQIDNFYYSNPTAFAGLIMIAASSSVASTYVNGAVLAAPPTAVATYRFSGSYYVT